MSTQQQQQGKQAVPPRNKFAAPGAVTTKHDRSPMKNIITGDSNVGKTFFVSTIDNVFVMPVEEGLKGASPNHSPGRYDVVPETYEELLQGFRYFRDVLNAPALPTDAAADAKPRRPYYHFATDSIAGMEKLVHLKACGSEKVDHMESKEYKAVWAAALPLWEGIIRELDAIRKTGVHIWVIAHSADAYDSAQTGANAGETFKVKDLEFRGSGKTLNELRSLWRQWADNVFYLVKTIKVIKGNKKGRNSTAEFTGRVLITQETATMRAKSRGALPPSMPATYEDLKQHWVAAVPARAEKIKAQIEKCMETIGEANRATILAATVQAADDALKLMAVLSRVQGMAALAAEEAGEPEEEPEGGNSDKGEDAPEEEEPPVSAAPPAANAPVDAAA